MLCCRYRFFFGWLGGVGDGLDAGLGEGPCGLDHGFLKRTGGAGVESWKQHE